LQVVTYRPNTARVQEALPLEAITDRPNIARGNLKWALTDKGLNIFTDKVFLQIRA